MKQFACPWCSRRLKIPDSRAGKPLRCPKCKERFHLSAKSQVPAIYRELFLSESSFEPKPTWIDAEFEDAPASSLTEHVRRAQAGKVDAFDSNDPAHRQVPADSGYGHELQSDASSRKRPCLVGALRVGLVIIMGTVSVLLPNWPPKPQDNIAAIDRLMASLGPSHLTAPGWPTEQEVTNAESAPIPSSSTMAGLERVVPNLTKATICQLPNTDLLASSEQSNANKQAIGRGLAVDTDATRVRYLSDMKAFDLYVAEGQFAQHGDLGYMAENPLKDRILVNGNESPNGISMRPFQRGFAKAKFAFPKDAETFQAGVALNDSAGTSGAPSGVGKINYPITFEVRADGRVLWKSQELDVVGKVLECSVSVAGVRTLELRVNSPGTWVANHAVWLEPRVTLKSP
jgi:NPCBM/NEW2 domain